MKQFADGRVEDDAMLAGKMLPSSIQKHKAQGNAQSYSQLPCQEEGTGARSALAMLGQLEY